MLPIYLDFNGTTPVDPEVFSEMLPFLSQHFGNPSSTHFFGLNAKSAIEIARYKVASLIHSKPEEIIFTASGTEANNLAIRGTAKALQHAGNHIITSAIEHPSVLEVCKQLELEGFRISYLTVDESGIVDTALLKQLITPSTILISVMHANNETGSIQPISEITAIARKHGIMVHTDASQSAGKITVDVDDLGVDLLTIAGHKLYAPKGIGALYIREGKIISPIIYGAAQERGIRPGTENVKDIVALGKACEIAGKELSLYNEHCSELISLMYNELKKQIPNVRLNGHPDKRLPNTLNISFKGILNGDLIKLMPELCLSTGAACHSDSDKISHVLQAMKTGEEYSRGSIRISIGKTTTTQETKTAIQIICNAFNELKKQGINTRVDHQTESGILNSALQPGCSCKINPDLLTKILENINPYSHDDLIVDSKYRDDAAVYKISNDLALIQTVDFLTPIVNDPYKFGRIAAANAFSDVYAMGGKPAFALNVVGFPSDKIPYNILNLVISGGADLAREESVPIAGGHSINNEEFIYGMSVSGFVHPEKILRNSTAKAGDAIILTKPIGTGIIAHAAKLGMAGSISIESAIKFMGSLNKIILKLVEEFEIHACTDVTGFGLSGHLNEMAAASSLDATVNFSRISLINGVKELAIAGLHPQSTVNNLSYSNAFMKWHDKTALFQKHIFCDAQTSGGLLISCNKKDENKMIQFMKTEGITDACCIGYFTSSGSGRIELLP